MSEITVKADEVIFNKGDEANYVFMVISGIVTIEDGGRFLNQINQYGLFGELGTSYIPGMTYREAFS